MKPIDFLTGVLYCLGAVCMWVGSTLLINALYADVSDSPYFITYFSEAFKVIYLILFLLPFNRVKYDRVKYPVKSVMITALLYGSLMIISTYVFDLGLNYTTPSSGLCVNTTYTIFTCVLSTIFLKEKLTWYKYTACGLAITGIVIICVGDKAHTFKIFIGDLLSLIAAIMYAMLAVIVKYRITDDEGFPYFMMMGISGGIIIIGYWPEILLLNFTGYEKFIMPQLKEIGLLSLLALTNSIIPDYFYLKAIILLGPTLCTFVYILIIPLSIVGDYFYEGTHYNLLFWIGNLIIVASFSVLMGGTYHSEKQSHDKLDTSLNESFEISNIS